MIEMWQKCLTLVTQHPWLLLVAVGLLNECVQRYPKLRANSLFQVLPNILMASPLGRVPLLGAALDLLDTPRAPEPVAPKPGTVLDGDKPVEETKK